MSGIFYPAWTVRWREGKYSVNLVCRAEIYMYVLYVNSAVLICVAFKKEKRKKRDYLQSSPTALHNSLKLWWCGLAHIHSTTDCLAVWSENLEYLGEIVLWKSFIIIIYEMEVWCKSMKTVALHFIFFNRVKCQAVCWPSLFTIPCESVALCVWRCLALVLWITTAFYVI